MKTIVLFGVLAVLAGSTSAQHFEPPVRITAGGDAIDTDVGHAAPFMGDWDGDGVNDLLVGQFGDGILWIYRNTGTNDSPRFESAAQFQSGSDDGRVPTG